MSNISSSRLSLILKQLASRVVSNKVCQQQATKIGLNVPISKEMLCAGDLNKLVNKVTCSGDSGGPLVCKKSNGQWFLEGVASFGAEPCNGHIFYSVFARVSEFRDWIKSYTGF